MEPATLLYDRSPFKKGLARYGLNDSIPIMRGFSLVELSIVLVILGLLTGGILAGQSLIRASELRAVTSEYQRYATAVNTFRDKYFVIPGDMLTATKFWGDDDAACPDAGTPNGTPGTCNGDGDGMIEAAGAPGTGESAQFWKQLQLAGLIEGSYSGLVGASGSWHCVVGTDCPRSRMSNGGWGTAYTASGNAALYAINYGNRLLFGAATSNSVPTDPSSPLQRLGTSIQKWTMANPRAAKSSGVFGMTYAPVPTTARAPIMT